MGYGSQRDGGNGMPFMKKLVHFVVIPVLLLPVVLGSGCDQSAAWLAVSPAFYLLNSGGSAFGGGDGNKADPVGADIAGDWAGYYENDETGDRENITATVSQDGDAVSITTSKTGPGHHLTGAISAEAHLFMTDSYDGQTWTSQTPATHNSLEIGDYTYKPEPGAEDSPPLQFLQLYR
jgi:hypothetical protein